MQTGHTGERAKSELKPELSEYLHVKTSSDVFLTLQTLKLLKEMLYYCIPGDRIMDLYTL